MERKRETKLPRRTVIDDDVILKNKNEKTNNDDEEHVNANVELTFDVITIIFKSLNAKDLHSAAMVCRCWNEAAENEKRVRTANVVSLTTDFGNSWPRTNRFANELRTKPMVGFMFTRPFDATHPAKAKNKADCPCRFLPSKCANIIVGNGGVVSETIEMEDEPEKAAWILLPWDKDVTVEIISVGLIRNKAITDERQNALKRLKELTVTPNTVKCFILLERQPPPSSAFNIIDDIPRNWKSGVVGGIVSDLALCKHDEKENKCLRRLSSIGILISGPTVRSWCVVIEEICDTKDKIMAKLELLKKQVKLRRHSVGFMFACRGRGEYMLGAKNVESTAFKKLFPKVPLIGSFGNGEFGDSTVDRGQERVHQYSTVFTIVTYGS